MTNSPCYKCDTRNATCRIGCTGYKEWERLHLEEKEKIRKAEREARRFGAHDFDMFEKSGRKQRWK